ncbi:MAG: ZinT/AdcA family metal-binding protein [Tissierellia bacterium]|nr:ZinT/AdcA family metal-binding protein [Tissierellia bacterium]
MRNKKSLLMICLVLIFSLVLVACGKSEPNENEAAQNNTAVENVENNNAQGEEEAEEVPISEWEGAWNNMKAYLDAEELVPAFEEVAERDGISPEEAKAELEEKRDCEFDGFVVEGTKVTFLDGFQDDGGQEIDSANYEFVETHEVQHGNSTLEWDVYKADKEDAKYPVLLMMPVHGEEALIHFHMRYGDDKDTLLAKEGWYPTFVKPSTTYEQLAEEVTE